MSAHPQGGEAVYACVLFDLDNTLLCGEPTLPELCTHLL